MNSSNYKSRFLIVDLIRGFTVVLMIFFHFCFDLNNFEFIHVDIINGRFWYILPRIIVFLFLFLSGLSLTLKHQFKIKWPHFLRRATKLILFALAISLVTYILFPNNWIYFGTLHAIALVSILILPFLNYPNLSLFIALSLFVPSIFFDYNLPFFELKHSSLDYISPFPWMGAGLIGIFAAHKKLHLIELPINENHLLIKSLNYLGKHSLSIYLIHQPILYGTVFLFHQIIHLKA